MLCKILLVDDEPPVINALRRELMRPPLVGTDGIEVESFTQPLDALARIAEPDGDFDAAIVDYRMPGMTGTVLLDYLRLRRPDTVRILLTGQIDLDGAIAAINSARVDHLLTKPWHEYQGPRRPRPAPARTGPLAARRRAAAARRTLAGAAGRRRPGGAARHGARDRAWPGPG